MPATEKTWRDQAKMHVLFGISALVMLVGTIWMLAKDHNREWRKWQLGDRGIESWTIQSQLAQSEADSTVALDRLQRELLASQSTAITAEQVSEFKALVEREDARLKQAAEEAKIRETPKPADFSRLDRAAAAVQDAEQDSSASMSARQSVIDEMNVFIREAKRREGALLTTKKFKAADQTADVSVRGIAVGEGKPTAEVEAKIETLKEEIASYDADVASAKDYRVALESLVKQIQSEELDLQKQISAEKTDQNRLRENLGKYSTTAGEWVNRAPVLDALYTGNLKLDQIWLPEMKINYNFSSVSRYDRCIVCHRAIDKTAPGSATEPAYPAIPRADRIRTLQLTTLSEEDKNKKLEDAKKLKNANKAQEAKELAEQAANSEEVVKAYGPADALALLYGITLAPRGQVEATAVTIQVVQPLSLGAVAGLQMGDILLEINGGPITSQDDVAHYLLDIVEWGKPVSVKIKRGLDQPFTSHPRLDLFVGSTSPHKKGEMGCTICHDGQGSATEFKWASHTPNDAKQGLDWSRKYGWFDNHHWIFPMTPERFIESNCLKCHHEVVELEPSERFPQPPAPKLVKGYELVREYGCYGCHEIGGFDGPNKRIGPDLRLEPNFAEVASQILSDPALNPQERELAAKVVADPNSSGTRDELSRMIQADGAAAQGAAGAAEQPPAKPRLSAETHSLAGALKDLDAPGSLRKVGPSLRHINSKVDFNWLFSWIRKPADFRPTTKMPQFFFNHEHLDAKQEAFPIHDVEGRPILDAQKNPKLLTDLDYTKRFENIEIRALSQFLLANSKPFEYIGQPKGITELPSTERGKWQFETRGCLACHSHVDFPNIHSTQGPDLSRLAAKLNTPKGQQWLYSWLKAPNHYYPRTAMPNVYLDPIAEKDPTGNLTGKVSDPAADIMAFLLSVPTDWKPEAVAPAADLTPDEIAALNDLTTVWLAASFPRRSAEKFAVEGIPDKLRATVKVDEQVLLGNLKDNPSERVQRQLTYVARRSIGRYGCFGCHDIPGYEAAKPIGTPLASWGRKDPAQLAFENIDRFLVTHGEYLPSRGHIIDAPPPITPASNQTAHQSPAGDGAALAAHPGDAGAEHGGHHGIDPLDDKFDADTSYFLQSLSSHERHGFLWQKLRMPRSFDYETTRTKRYDERLRMPKFPFNAEEREAVMTFVLGLTNEAPATKYIYQPSPRQKAIVEGRHVLEKYNCAGCHILDMDRWQISFAPNQFEPQAETNEFPFLRPPVAPEQIQASVTPDRRGFLRADLHGMPMRDEATGLPRLVDVDGVPIEPDDKESPRFFEFQPFRNTVLNGQLRQVSVQGLRIPATMDGKRPADGTAYPGLGGDLAKYLYSRVIAEEKKTNPNVVATEAWGWLPPPLHNEGEKVQTNWLHDFLMDPTPIRPAAVLRMPNFNMSSEEAGALVDYFAAKNNAQFPYEYNSRRRASYLASVESTHDKVLDDAMKIFTDSNYCVKCHSLGDYQVKGAVKSSGPNLDQVYRRLRPDYVRRWIGKPERILPYTGMPVNFPYEPTPPHFGGVSQSLFPGTSTMQLDGMVDMLMNFDEYTRRKTSVKGLVKEAPPAGAAPAAAPAGQPSADDTPPNNTSAQR